VFWADALLSIMLPFVVFGAWCAAFAWWIQRVPPSPKALERVEAMGPPSPPVRVVDHKGNVRHEWAIDLQQQRLRHGGSQRW